MIEKLKREWSQLKRGQPGSRFQGQFDRNRKETSSKVGRVLRVLVGLLLLPVGLFMLAVPGPGLVVIAIGTVLIAREFKFAAKALDAIEICCRRLLEWFQARQRRRTAGKT